MAADYKTAAASTVDHYRELKEGHRAGRWVGPDGPIEGERG